MSTQLDDAGGITDGLVTARGRGVDVDQPHVFSLVGAEQGTSQRVH
jgi:hypothetical protein